MTQDLVAVPDHRDLPLQAIQSPLPFVFQEIGTVELRKQGCDLVVFLQQSATVDFGGMSGQHELDTKIDNVSVELIRGNPDLAETFECLRDGAGLRGTVGIAEIVPPTSGAMVLLGDVGESQKVGERAGDRNDLVELQPRQLSLDVVDAVFVLEPRFLRDAPQGFDHLEAAIALSPAYHVAKDCAEEPHVLPQRGMGVTGGVFGHGCFEVQGFFRVERVA